MANRNKLASALLNQTPGYKYGTILPMAYNPTTGDRKIAMPGLLAELLNSPVKMGQMAKGERDIDPGEVFQASMDFSPVGLLNKAPVGALGMNVFQGSPHKYGPKGASQSLKHIGKGEGAQAYGWGRYDAGAKEVAEQYQKNLSGPFARASASEVHSALPKKYQGGLSQADAIMRHIDDAINEGDIKKASEYLDVYDVQPDMEPAYRAAMKIYDQPGHLYKHDLPDEDIARYLDWDKPLSEQPESVRAALEQFGMKADPEGVRNYDDALLDALLNDANKALPKMPPNPRGEEIYRNVARKYGDSGDPVAKAASEALRKAGIPGLQYYDGMSRNAGDGTRNYVTWDQDVLDRMKLLERNGETFTSKTPPIAGLLSQKDREKREGLAGLLADGVRRGMAGGVF